VKSNRKLAFLVACLMVFSLAVAQGNINRAKLGDTRSVTLPSYAILDESAQPIIAASGKVGFVSSVTGGSLVSFSVASAKVLSSIVVGQSAGPISMIETAGRRLVAIPAVNDPAGGHPATISIIDATRSRSLELHTLVALPADAQITPSTRALLTGDGKFALIASSFDEPALLSFNVESGELASRLALTGRPSEMAFYESGESRRLAVASAVANNLALVQLDAEGQLSLASSFGPAAARFDEANNPAFSADGSSVFIAAATGDKLFQIDFESGSQTSSLDIDCPQRITVTKGAGGVALIGVMRIRRPTNNKPGGVTIVEDRGGRLAKKTEFTPPEGIEFTRANNVEFDSAGSVAFAGSATGMLFAFGVDTGELQAFHSVGRELRRVALNEKGRAVVAVRSAPSGDEVVIIGFDLVTEASDDAPGAISLFPDTVEQGRAKNLKLTVKGQNFAEGSSLIVGGNEVAADFIKRGKALEAKLPRSLFDQPGQITVQVKAPSGALSDPGLLSVVRPQTPIIDLINPTEIPGPGDAFRLKVKGQNFRSSSTIYVGDQPLNTERTGTRELRANVPAKMVRAVGSISIIVKDGLITDLISNDKPLTVYGPRISELRLAVEKVVAGAGSFVLRIVGNNFRDGAQVEINNKPVPSSRIIRQTGTLIKLSVSSKLIQEVGRLSVAVRNPGEGGLSNTKEIDALPPLIKQFGPASLLAGTSDLQLDVIGENFLRGATVFVGGKDKAVRIGRARVRFRSSTRLIVTLGSELSDLLAQPGSLKFQVVNPNRADGVASPEQALPVVGPEISQIGRKTDEDDATMVRLVIDGEHFRKGAIVEFFSGDTVLRTEIPLRKSSSRLSIVVRAKRLDGALANSQIRVVNPGNVLSNKKPIPREETAGVNED
jgi:IPT/TIG domain-containing protein